MQAQRLPKTETGWCLIQKNWGKQIPHIAPYTEWMHDQIKAIVAGYGNDLVLVNAYGTAQHYKPAHETDVMAELAAFFLTRREPNGNYVTRCKFREFIQR